MVLGQRHLHLPASLTAPQETQLLPSTQKLIIYFTWILSLFCLWASVYYLALTVLDCHIHPLIFHCWPFYEQTSSFPLLCLCVSKSKQILLITFGQLLGEQMLFRATVIIILCRKGFPLPLYFLLLLLPCTIAVSAFVAITTVGCVLKKSTWLTLYPAKNVGLHRNRGSKKYAVQVK